MTIKNLIKPLAAMLIAFVFTIQTALAGGYYVTVVQINSGSTFLQPRVSGQMLLSFNVDPSLDPVKLSKLIISCNPTADITRMELKQNDTIISGTDAVNTLTTLHGNGTLIKPTDITNFQVYADAAGGMEDIQTTCSIKELEFINSKGDVIKMDQIDLKVDKEKITRAELMQKMVTKAGIDPDETIYNNCFSDVLTQWHAKYICYAKYEDWIGGYGDNTFQPDNYVTKAEAVKMILNAYGLSVPTYVFDYPFEDIDPFEWYGPYVVYADKNDLLPDTGLYFYPGEFATHDYVSQVIERTLAYIQEMEVPQDYAFGNLTLTYPAKYEPETDDEYPGMVLFTSPDNNGIVLVPLDIFENMLAESGEDFETIFAIMQGENMDINVNKGIVSNYLDYNYYTLGEDYSDAVFIISQVDSENGSGESYIIFGMTSTGTMDEVMSIIETIEVS